MSDKATKLLEKQPSGLHVDFIEWLTEEAEGYEAPGDNGDAEKLVQLTVSLWADYQQSDFRKERREAEKAEKAEAAEAKKAEREEAKRKKAEEKAAKAAEKAEREEAKKREKAAAGEADDDEDDDEDEEQSTPARKTRAKGRRTKSKSGAEAPF